MSRRTAALVSAIQLAVGLAGMALALRRRRAFDIPFLRGSGATIARDSLVIGTAMSAPVVMLATQGCATLLIARGPSRLGSGILRALGAMRVLGYALERHVRARLTRPGFDAVETPLIAGGIVLSAAMAVPIRNG